MKVNNYSIKGAKLEAISLPKEWDEKVNMVLLAQAVRVYEDRSHVGFAKVKTRGEVNRTTKKLYKQKGTGGARHGSKGAPIFVGGGIAHGPTGLNRELSLPIKMKRKALKVALNVANENKKLNVASVNFKKTKEAYNFIVKVFGKKAPRITFVMAKENASNVKFLRNIKDVQVILYPNLNAYDVFFGGNIVIDKNIFSKKVEVKKGKSK